MQNGVSIIVCCYNSGKVIADCLRAAAAQERGNFELEIVLIDNNCTDDTVKVATETWHFLDNPYPLRIIKETTAGLNPARKRGVSECENKYLIFCDDDNRLEPGYAKNVYEEFEKNDHVGLVGGWSEGVYEIQKPGWFDAVATAYAVGGKPESDVENPKYVWGAGMSLRTELARKIFESNFKTVDRIGNILSAGGDLEICDLAKQHGYMVKKKMNLKFYHYITARRLTWNYCLKLYEGFGYSNTQYQHVNNGFNWKKRAGMIKGLLLFVIKNPLLFIKSIQKKEGELKTLRYYSMIGAIKFSFS